MTSSPLGTPHVTGTELPRPERATIRRATPDDWPAVRALLASEGLPLEGAAEHFANFLVAEWSGVVVGCVGVERYGSAGLLRSLAVDRSRRGTGEGLRLVEACVNDARASGLTSLTVRTMYAADFFARFGFRLIDVTDVLPEVQQSVEFQGACPPTVVTMFLEL